jgi:site-specific recombinase XerD
MAKHLTKQASPLPLFDTLDQVKERNPVLHNNTLTGFTKQDFHYAYDFLKQYDGNKATFNSYRREVERFLHFSWLIKQKSILGLNRQDIEDYITFCMNPPKSWVGLKKLARFKADKGQRVPNSEWRPFVATVGKSAFKKGEQPKKEEYELSQKTIREIFVAIGSFYQYLVSENIAQQNPVSSIRQKSKFIRKNQTAKRIPRLSDLQWNTVIELTKENANREPEPYERSLFILSAFYLMYLRISELVASTRWSPQMSHFFQDTHSNWWFKTVGKGNKERDITVSDAMLNALKRWRKFLNLSPALPVVEEKFPLIPKQRGKGNVSDTKIIYNIVQKCFDLAVEQLRASHDLQEAENLAQASAHWLRHTGISDDINKHNRPIAHVRDDAGHASIATTDRYNDITLQERHASGKRKKL